MKVAILGATGLTGGCVLDGLLASSDVKFEVTALVRPPSLNKPQVLNLQKRGVQVVSFDIDGPVDAMAASLKGMDVVLSFVLFKEKALVDAAKKAGVGRFVPCWYATAMPRGVMSLRDGKDAILDYVQLLHLPYTAIDVGWWYQISIPRLPSGRFDDNLFLYSAYIPGDGNVPSARIDRRDIGKYVARIIADPRTLNKKVFACADLRTHNDIYDVCEELSGEKIPRVYRSVEEVDAEIAKAKADPDKFMDLFHYSYHKSCDILGENTPEFARYLGYLVTTDLYPDLQAATFEEYFKETLEKGLERMFDEYRDMMLKHGTLPFRGAPQENSNAN